MKLVRALVAAFSYFSILPVRSTSYAPDAAVVGWLPLVGGVIGMVSGGAAHLVVRHAHMPLAGVVIAFFASVVLSGAIHVDGFLDCADALLMTAPAARRLEVLRDPAHGTYAVVAMALLTVIWIAALAQIDTEQMVVILPFAAMLSRAAAIPLAGEYPHARSGVTMQGPVAYGLMWFVVLGTLSWAVWRVWQAPLLVVGAYLCAQLVGAIAARRLGGGLTGDVYGAAIVVTDVALLLAAPSLLPRL